jgi:hypothetical protein
MKITLLTPALVAIVGLALVGAPVTAQAQTSTNATAPAAPSTAPKVKEKKKSEFTEYKDASITAIAASSLTVTTPKGSLTLAIAPDTKFAKLEGKKKTPATAADFAVGDKVSGSYKTNADGTMTAHSIHKKVAAAK